MAVPAYTNDLTDWIIDSDTTAWTEYTNMAAGGAPDEVDTESALQGTNTVSQATNTTSLFSMGRSLGASVTLASGEVFLVWHGHGVATALLSYASGGLRLVIGAAGLGDWKAYAVGGNDVPPFPYGKWVNNPIDPTLTADYTNGTPPTGGTAIFSVGSAGILSLAVAKGQPHVVDMIRYGRAQSRFTGGETSNYCVFSGYATVNDATSARWGLISATSGGYLWKGLMMIGLSTVATTQRARTTNVATLTVASGHGLRVGDIVVISGLGGTGYNATAAITARTATSISYANTGANEGTTADTGGLINGVADFRDSNKNIFIQDTRKVSATFNKVEIRNSSTNVDWSGINFVNPSPSTTASKGDFEVVDNATVVMDACNFTDMNTFIFLGNSDVTDCQFLRCGRITSGGGLFNGTSVLSSTVAADEGAFFYDVNADPDGAMDGMTFSMGANSHHAIRFGTNVPATMTLRNCTFTGFSSSDDVNGSVFRFDDTTGNITLNLVGCTTDGAFSVDDAAGVTVEINIDPVTTLVNIKDEEGNNEAGVAVYLEAADATGDLPYQQSITSITRFNTTATVTFAAAHGLETNEYLKLYGITDKVEDLSGAHQVSVTSATVLTYETSNSGSTNYTGTITGTGATIYGTTDVNGNISSSRTYTVDQPLRGYARKGTSAPYYKPIELIDTVDSTNGLTLNRRLVLDE